MFMISFIIVASSEEGSSYNVHVIYFFKGCFQLFKYPFYVILPGKMWKLSFGLDIVFYAALTTSMYVLGNKMVDLLNRGGKGRKKNKWI